MEWLNYHHLHYFWIVAREGGIAAAARVLHVGRPSISMQLKSLERALGEPLFERRGRRLELTEVGRTVFEYADEIFRLGRELQDTVRGRLPSAPLRLRVGVADVTAKLVAFRLLDCVLDLGDDVFLEVSEHEPRHLFIELALHRLDLVLSDARLPADVDVRAYNHLLGESTTTLFAARAEARSLRRGFPRSLDGAPFLMPARNTPIRRDLEAWLSDVGVRPRIVGEFEDSALLTVFGRAGRGVFPVATAIADEVAATYGVAAIGELPDVVERYYAISTERRIKHPAVAAIRDAARERLFPAAT